MQKNAHKALFWLLIYTASCVPSIGRASENKTPQKRTQTPSLVAQSAQSKNPAKQPAPAHRVKATPPKATLRKVASPKAALGKAAQGKAGAKPPTHWPVMLSFDPSAAQGTPSFSIKSFVSLGATIASQGPNFRFHVTEAELDLTFRLTKWARFEFAMHYLDGVVDLTTTAALSWIDSLVQKALLKFNLPKGFSIIFGKYFAFQGWESENTLGRNMITGSFAYNNTPSTQTGFVLGYAKAFKVLSLGLNAFAINNWDSNLHNAFFPSGGLNVSLEFRFGAVGLNLNTTLEVGTQPGIVKAALATAPVLSWNTNLQLSFFGGKFFILGDAMIAMRPGGTELSYASMGMLHGMFTRYVGFTARYSHFEDMLMKTDTTSSNNEWALALLLKPLQISKPSGAVAALGDMMVMIEGRLDTNAFDFNNAGFALRFLVIVPFQATLSPGRAKGQKQAHP